MTCDAALSCCHMIIYNGEHTLLYHRSSHMCTLYFSYKLIYYVLTAFDFSCMPGWCPTSSRCVETIIMAKVCPTYMYSSVPLYAPITHTLVSTHHLQDNYQVSMDTTLHCATMLTKTKAKQAGIVFGSGSMLL